MSEIKHVGRVRATGKKCVVAYRTLPGDAYTCLIVPTENLPDSYHDSLINLVESTAGQDSHEFAEAMARTNFPDGSIMLAALHVQNRLVKVATDQIEMLPTPGVSIQLSELNQIIAEQRGIAIDDLSIKSGEAIRNSTAPIVATPKPAPSDVARTTSASVNESEETALASMTAEDQAKKFRSDADKLSKQAAEMRRKAEELVPTKKVK